MTRPSLPVSATDIALAVGLGALAGARAALPNALISHAASARPSRGGLLGSAFLTRALSVAGLLELVGDKLPGVPARVDTSPRLARIGSGGLAAAALGRPHLGPMAVLALVGGVTAALFTTLTYRFRRRATRRWGLSNQGSGLLEDALVLGAAALLLPQLRKHAPIQPLPGLGAIGGR